MSESPWDKDAAERQARREAAAAKMEKADAEIGADAKKNIKWGCLLVSAVVVGSVSAGLGLLWLVVRILRSAWGQ